MKKILVCFFIASTQVFAGTCFMLPEAKVTMGIAKYQLSREDISAYEEFLQKFKKDNGVEIFKVSSNYQSLMNYTIPDEYAEAITDEGIEDISDFVRSNLHARLSSYCLSSDDPVAKEKFMIETIGYLKTYSEKAKQRLDELVSKTEDIQYDENGKEVDATISDHLKVLSEMRKPDYFLALTQALDETLIALENGEEGAQEFLNLVFMSYKQKLVVNSRYIISNERELRTPFEISSAEITLVDLLNLINEETSLSDYSPEINSDSRDMFVQAMIMQNQKDEGFFMNFEVYLEVEGFQAPLSKGILKPLKDQNGNITGLESETKNKIFKYSPLTEQN